MGGPRRREPGSRKVGRGGHKPTGHRGMRVIRTCLGTVAPNVDGALEPRGLVGPNATGLREREYEQDRWAVQR